MDDNRIGYVIYILDSENIAKVIPLPPLATHRWPRSPPPPPPRIPHPAGLAEVPLHVSHGQFPVAKLTTNPPTNTPTTVPPPPTPLSSPLVPHKPLLPISPHVPIPQLSFIHIQMIHSFFHQLLPSAPVAR